ncbi:YfhO family protein [Clostridiaceae bacterium NSJ-31]|uniref:YfhO family protein n=1 Tax=Ligaoa zhengdingensis TaxID=2763658 RepID=A0A926I4P1_9FIRM|nr:YfhO family protein [Ligaoa zhengdingensis]MBC8546605.1 YfhO family protein [Ligaoa zhengdingensis]
MNSLLGQPQKSKHWLTFWVALATAAAFFLPFVIYNRGLFVYIGDFNCQQIPFYKLAHEAVRSGDIFWNWYTDLGANFIGSYSFYLLFSPFFWLTLLFPTAAVPYLMAPLLVLKTACAALTSYFYIQRFVRDKNYAVIGALLYAFSGFTAYNIFFNHFHEVIVFFPLMLIGLEELLVNDRKGAFAVTVAINAMVNYWFFVGEVVFVILYYFVRCTGLKGGFKKILWVAFEGLLGVLISAFALLPSALAVMGNPRTTFPENLLSGWQFWLYTHEQRQPGIVASFFFPPDTPSRPNMFPDHGAKWASLSAWLPLFSMSGVLAYLISVRKNWLRKLLIACFVVAMVPGLNSLFVGLNHSYYTRWFYMLILLMALATAATLENERIDFARGFRWTAVITAAIAIPIGFTPVIKDGEIEQIGLAKDMRIFWVYVALAVIALALCYLLMFFARRTARFQRIALVMLCCFTFGYTTLYLAMSKQTLERDNYIIDNGVHGRANLTMPVDPDDEFYRTDIYDSGENFGMYWHLPNIQAFHSVVPVSIMEFYPEVGVKRDVSSRPQPEYFALRSLFSVRYLFIDRSKEEQDPMPGYHLVDQQLDFNIYENENYLPMGFAFDAYLTREEFDEIPTDLRHKVLMRALVLDEERAATYGPMLEHLEIGDTNLPEAYTDFLDDVDARRSMACSDFTRDNLGFTATCNFDQPRLVFFSVPYEAGWSATVNGEEAQVEKVDIGFMAVRVPAGACEIRFDYMTPGLLPGLAVSGGAILVLLAYWLFFRSRSAKRRGRPADPPRTYELFDPDQLFPAEDEPADGFSLDHPLSDDGEEPEPEELYPPAGELPDPSEVRWEAEDFTGAPGPVIPPEDGEDETGKDQPKK